MNIVMLAMSLLLATAIIGAALVVIRVERVSMAILAAGHRVAASIDGILNQQEAKA